MIRYGSRVLRNIFSKPVFLYSTSVAPNESTKSILIQRLSDEFTTAKKIILKLKGYNKINVNFNEWKSRIEVMRRFHFSDLECFEMISLYPSLLEIPMWKFEDTILQWHQIDMKTDFKSIFLNQPVLFEVDGADIRSRIPQLLFYFGPSNAVKLLIQSPNVMYDNWESVLTRINYLLKVRRFNAGEIIQFDSLSRTLDFMKFRFELLEKCGIYKQSTVPIHKINKYDKSGHMNPSLRAILLTNTKEFLKYAKISQEEYDVYRDLFMTNECDESDSDTED